MSFEKTKIIIIVNNKTLKIKLLCRSIKQKRNLEKKINTNILIYYYTNINIIQINKAKKRIKRVFSY